MPLTLEELTQTQLYQDLEEKEQGDLLDEFLGQQVEEGKLNHWEKFLNSRRTQLQGRYNQESDRRKKYLGREHALLRSLEDSYINSSSHAEMVRPLTNYMQQIEKLRKEQSQEDAKAEKEKELAQAVIDGEYKLWREHGISMRGEAATGWEETKGFLGETALLAKDIVVGTQGLVSSALQGQPQKKSEHEQAFLDAMNGGAFGDPSDKSTLGGAAVTSKGYKRLRGLIQDGRERENFEKYIEANAEEYGFKPDEAREADPNKTPEENLKDEQKEFASGLAQKWIDEEDIEDLPKRDSWDPGNINDERRLRAKRAREELEKLGYAPGKEQDDLIQKVSDSLKPFKDHTEPYRIDSAGEIEFNPLHLLRNNQSAVASEIMATDLPKNVKRRAIKKIPSLAADAQQAFLDVYDDQWGDIQEYEGDTDEQKINSFLESKQGKGFLKGFGRFWYAFFNQAKSSALSLKAGLAGMLGDEQAREEAYMGMEQLQKDLSYIGLSGLPAFASETGALAVDVLVARGGATIAKGAVKIGRYNKIAKLEKKKGFNPDKLPADLKKDYGRYKAVREKAMTGAMVAASGSVSGIKTVGDAMEAGLPRDEAIILGIQAMAITSLVTWKGAKTGDERFAMGQLLKQNGRKFSEYLKKDLLAEGAEEFVDEFLNGLVVQSQINPDQSAEELVGNATHAFFLSMIFGGTLNLPGQVVDKTQKLGAHFAKRKEEVPEAPGSEQLSVIEDPPIRDNSDARQSNQAARDAIAQQDLDEQLRTATTEEELAGEGLPSEGLLSQEAEEQLVEETPETDKPSAKRVQDKEGRRGVVETSYPGSQRQPASSVVKFDDGTTRQVPTDTLSPLTAEEDKPKKKKERGKKQVEEDIDKWAAEAKEAGLTPGSGQFASFLNERERQEYPDRRRGSEEHDIEALKTQQLSIDAVKAGEKPAMWDGGVRSGANTEGLKVIDVPDGTGPGGVIIIKDTKEGRAAADKVMAAFALMKETGDASSEKRHRMLGEAFGFSKEEVDDFWLMGVAYRKMGSPTPPGAHGATVGAVKALGFENWKHVLRTKNKRNREAGKPEVPVTREEFVNLSYKEIRALAKGSESAQQRLAARDEKGPAGEPGVKGEPAPEKAPEKKVQSRFPKKPINLGGGVQATKEEMFGPAPKGKEANPNLNTSRFKLVNEEGQEGIKRLVHGKRKSKTDRLYNTKTKKWFTDTTRENVDRPVSSIAFRNKKKAQDAAVELKPEGGRVDVQKRSKRVNVNENFRDAGADADAQETRTALISGKNAQNKVALEALYDLPGKVEADSKGGRAAMIDAETGTVKLNPEHKEVSNADVFGRETIPQATALRGALDNDNTTDSLVPALQKAGILEASEDQLINPDDDSRAKAVVAKVLVNGDSKVGNKTLRETFVDAISENAEASKEVENILDSIRGTLKEAGDVTRDVFDKGRTELDRVLTDKGQTILGTAASFTGDIDVAPIKEKSGVVWVTASQFDNLHEPTTKPGDKFESATIDSSPGKHPGVKENVQSGSVLEVRSDADSDVVVERWLVKSTHPREGGAQRHYLEKIPKDKAKVEGLLGKYFLDESQRDRILQAIDFVGSNKTAAQLRKEMENLARFVFGKVAGPDYADEKLNFVSSDDAPPGKSYKHAYLTRDKDGNTLINVNSEVWYNHLLALSQSLEGKNDLARITVAEDFANLINSIAFEEAGHDVAVGLFGDNEVTSTVDEWLDIAMGEGTEAIAAKTAFIRWYLRTVDGAWKRDKTPNDYWNDILKLAGKVEKEEGDVLPDLDWKETKLQIGHETLMGLISQLRSGNTALDLQKMTHTWMNTFVNTKAGQEQGEGGKTARLIKRLVEMASRAFESIRRYFHAHKELSALPPRLEKMLNQLDAALDEGGITINDIFNIEQSALERADHDLDRSMMMADQNWDQELHEKQEALQDALRQVKSLLVDTGLDDEDEADVGNLINYQFNQDAKRWEIQLNEDIRPLIPIAQRSTIENSLLFINNSGRPNTIAQQSLGDPRTGLIGAKEYERVLSRLGVVGVSRVEPGDPRARVLRDAEFGRAPREPQFAPEVTVDKETGREQKVKGLRIVGRTRAEQKAIVENLEDEAADAIASKVTTSRMTVGSKEIFDETQDPAWEPRLAEASGPVRKEDMLQEFSNVLGDAHNKAVTAKHEQLQQLETAAPKPPFTGTKFEEESARIDSELEELVGSDFPALQEILALEDISDLSPLLRGAVFESSKFMPKGTPVLVNMEPGQVISGRTGEGPTPVGASDVGAGYKYKYKDRQLDRLKHLLIRKGQITREALRDPGALGIQMRAWKKQRDVSKSQLSRLYANLPGRTGVNSFGDLLDEWGNAKERSRIRGTRNIFDDAVSELTNTPEEAASLRAELDRQQVLLSSVKKLQTLAEEMDHVLLGGRVPERLQSLRRERNSEWDFIELQDSAEKSIPFGLPEALLSFGLEGEGTTAFDLTAKEGVSLEDLRLHGMDVEETRKKIDDLYEVLATAPENSAEKTSALLQLQSEETQKVLQGYGLRIQHTDASGRTFGLTFLNSPDPDFAAALAGAKGQKLIDLMGNAVSGGRMSIINMAGGNTDLADVKAEQSKDFPSDRIERTAVVARMHSRAALEGERLTENLIHSLSRADPNLDYGVLATAGFPAYKERVEAGTELDPETKEEVPKYKEILRLDPDAFLAVGAWPNLNAQTKQTEEIIDPKTGEVKTVIKTYIDPETGETKPVTLSEFVGPDIGFKHLMGYGQDKDGNFTGEPHVAELLLEIGSKLESMLHSSSTQDKAIMYTEEGLTPAGYVYQLLANPLIDFLAKTKGTTIDGVEVIDLLVRQWESSDSKFDKQKAVRLRKIYANLAPGLENASAFADSKNAVGPDKTRNLFNDFVSLRRLAKVSNTVYSSSLRQLEHNRAFRRVVRKSRSAVTSELRANQTQRYPINLRMLAQAETQAEHAQRRFAASQLERADRGEVIPHAELLLLPRVNARKMISNLTRFRGTSNPLVIKERSDDPGRGEVDTSAVANKGIADSYSGSSYLLHQSENAQHSLNATELSELTREERWSITQRQEQMELNALADERTKILLQLHGNSRTAVLNFINQREFILEDRVLDEATGKTIRVYDTEAIDQALYAKLERIVIEGKDDGVRGLIDSTESTPKEEPELETEDVTFRPYKPEAKPVKKPAIVNRALERLRKAYGMREDVYDSEGNLIQKGDPGPGQFDDKGELLEGTRPAEEERYNDLGMAITWVLENDGWVSTRLDPDEASSSLRQNIPASHTQNRWTTLLELTSHIPNLKIVRGKSHRDSADIIPSIAFIPDPNEPVILLPFREGSHIRDEHIQKALKDVIVFLGKHGNVDVVGKAQALLQLFADYNSEFVKIDERPDLPTAPGEGYTQGGKIVQPTTRTRSEVVSDNGRESTMSRLRRHIRDTALKQHEQLGTVEDQILELEKNLELLKEGREEEGADSANLEAEIAVTQQQLSDLKRAGAPRTRPSQTTLSKAKRELNSKKARKNKLEKGLRILKAKLAGVKVWKDEQKKGKKGKPYRYEPKFYKEDDPEVKAGKVEAGDPVRINGKYQFVKVDLEEKDIEKIEKKYPRANPGGTLKIDPKLFVGIPSGVTHILRSDAAEFIRDAESDLKQTKKEIRQLELTVEEDSWVQKIEKQFKARKKPFKNEAAAKAAITKGPLEGFGERADAIFTIDEIKDDNEKVIGYMPRLKESYIELNKWINLEIRVLAISRALDLQFEQIYSRVSGNSAGGEAVHGNPRHAASTLNQIAEDLNNGEYDTAADVIATFVTSDHLKNLLSLLSIGNEVESNPHSTGLNFLLSGKLMRSDSMSVVEDLRVAPFVEQPGTLADLLSFGDREGAPYTDEYNAATDNFHNFIRRNADDRDQIRLEFPAEYGEGWRQMEEVFGSMTEGFGEWVEQSPLKSKLSREDQRAMVLKEFAMLFSPYMAVHGSLENGNQNADKLLSNTMDMVPNFDVEPKGLEHEEIAPRKGVNEMEARQLMKLLGQETISEIVKNNREPGVSEEEVDADIQALFDSNVTIATLQKLEGPVIKAIMKHYENVLRDELERENKNLHDASAMLPGLNNRYEASKRSDIYETRELEQGRLSAASLLEPVDGLVDVSDWDKDRLRAELQKAGLPVVVKRGNKMVDIVDEEYDRMTAARKTRNIFADEREARKAELLVEIDQIEDTISKVSDTRSDFEKQVEAKKFLEALSTDTLYDLFDGNTENIKLVDRIQKLFFNSRAGTINAIAEAILDGAIKASKEADTLMSMPVRQAVDEGADIAQIFTAFHASGLTVVDSGKNRGKRVFRSPSVETEDPASGWSANVDVSGAFTEIDPETKKEKFNEEAFENFFSRLIYLKGWDQEEDANLISHWRKKLRTTEYPTKSNAVKLVLATTDRPGSSLPVRTSLMVDVEALVQERKDSPEWQEKVARIMENIDPSFDVGQIQTVASRYRAGARTEWEGYLEAAIAGYEAYLNRVEAAVNSVLGEGMVTSKLPAIPDTVEEFVKAVTSGEFAQDIKDLQGYVRSLENPAKVLEDLRKQSVSRAIDDLRKNEFSPGVAGALTGNARPGLYIPFRFGKGDEAVTLEDVIEQALALDSRAEQLEFIKDKLADYFQVNLDTLLGSENLPQDHPNYTKGRIHDILGRKLEQAKTSLRMVEDELFAINNTELKEKKSPEFTGKLSGYLNGEYRNVRLVSKNDNGTDLELTQRVINRIAHIHSRFYDEFFDRATDLNPYIAHQKALALADDALVRRHQVRRAVEKAKGRKYTVSGDLLVPWNIDQRIERELIINDLAVTEENKQRLFDEIALFTTAGISPDDKDMLDVDRKFYREPIEKFEKHREKADKVWEALKKQGRGMFYDYDNLTEEENNILGDGKGEKLLSNIEAVHKEMFAYILSARDFLNTITADRANFDYIGNKKGNDALLELADRVERFASALESSLDKGSPDVPGSMMRQLLSIYADTKGFVTSLKHVDALVMGFIDNRPLLEAGSTHYASLMHHDSKIKDLFAGTLESQSIAHGITHILDYGIVSGVNKLAGGRSGHKANVDDIQKVLSAIIPRRKSKSFRGGHVKAGPVEVNLNIPQGFEGASITFGESDLEGKKDAKKVSLTAEQVNTEQAALGYAFESIKSHLAAKGRKHRSLPAKAQELMDMFDVSEASYEAAAEQKKDLKRDKVNIEFLDDYGIFKLVKDNFYPALEKIVNEGVTDIFEATAIISTTASELDADGIEFGNNLNALFGLMSKLYQAQAQLIPKSETVSEENDRWNKWAMEGTRHMSNLPTVNFRWHRQFVTEADLQRHMAAEDGVDGPQRMSISEKLSMTKATWLKSAHIGYDDETIQILDFNGLRAPMALLSDMAHRMHVAPVLEIIQAITGENEHLEGQGRRFTLNTLPGREGALSLYFSDRAGTDNGTRKSTGRTVTDIASVLGYLHQDIIAKDLERVDANTSLEDFLEFYGKAGMTSRLFSFSQWWRQSIFGVAMWGLFHEGPKNLGPVLLEYARQGRGRADVFGLGKNSTRNEKIAQFVKDKMYLIYLRQAEGQEMFGSAMQKSIPEFKNRGVDILMEGKKFHGSYRATANAVKGVISNMARKYDSANNKALALTIAASEKWAIQSIVMTALTNRANEIRLNNIAELGETKITSDDLLNPDHPIHDFLTSGDFGDAAIKGIEILGQSDTSKKGDAFQRRGGIPQKIIRGLYLLFSNHMVSTAATMHSGLRMTRRGKDKETKLRGAGTAAMTFGQNAAFTFFTHQTATWILSHIYSGLHHAITGDEEDEVTPETVQKWMYGIPPNGEEAQWDDHFRRYAARLIGGKGKPPGYDTTQGKFTEAKKKQDWGRLWAMTGSEIMPMFSGWSMYLGTNLPNITGFNAKTDPWLLAAKAATGEDVFYENVEGSGIILGEGKLGGADDWGPISGETLDKAELLVYYASKYGSEKIANSSYIFMGMDYLVGQPVRKFLNTDNMSDVGMGAWGAYVASIMPWVGTNRDSRTMLDDIYTEKVQERGSKFLKWHGQSGWQQAGKGRDEGGLPQYIQYY